MTICTLRVCAVVLEIAIWLIAQPACATNLDIDPVAQQTPEWCWAATSEMVLSYYGYPNLNPGGDYQCGVVGAQGGICSANCAMCLNGGGTTQRIALVIRLYTIVAAQLTGYTNSHFHPVAHGVLSPQQIVASIDNDAPVLAGITPNGIPFPPGLGISQHAVLIVGYEGDAKALNIILNDPYPYSGVIPPYIQVGGKLLQSGQYEIPYQILVTMFHYGNSITFD